MNSGAQTLRMSRRSRYSQIDPEDNLHGAPDIVVEVLSRSNTIAEIDEKEQICLANGSKEFLVVNQFRKNVRLTTPAGRPLIYVEGDEIPLPLFGSEAKIKVDDNFRY
jgi:Uma2 family endonuclease